MTRLTLANLDDVARQAQERHGRWKSMLMVCAGTGCVSAKSLPLRDAFRAELERRGLQDQIRVVATGCNGFCAHGPICVVQPEGVFYERLKPEAVPELIESHFVRKQPLEQFLFHGADEKTVPFEKDIEFFAKQQCIALRNRGKIDPEDIEDAVRAGAYQALRKVLAERLEGDALVRLLVRSGLRGRGGGGFPTGVKWESCLKAARERGLAPVVVCNGDEGDPGAFMDRSIVEADPHAVIEGMIIGAWAMGATEGFVYIRHEYPLAMKRLNLAIEQARARGLLGRDILGSGFDFDITVHRGAGAFVCGESTALMASMEGRAGEPRAKYVHTVEHGFRDRPTVLNNVETWANVPLIVGTAPSGSRPSAPATCRSPVGRQQRHQGLLAGRQRAATPAWSRCRWASPCARSSSTSAAASPTAGPFKAVQTGGPSGGCLPESKLDLPVDFDTLTEAGSMMGSGGMIVMDDHTCMVDVARYFVDFLSDESCGKCTPCREGLVNLREMLEPHHRGAGARGRPRAARGAGRGADRRLAVRAGPDRGQPGALDPALLPRRVRGPHPRPALPGRGVQGPHPLRDHRGLHGLHGLRQRSARPTPSPASRASCT